MAPLNNISVGQLRQAVEIKTRIEKLQGELEGILNGGTTTKAAGVPYRGRSLGRRRMSAAGRAKIAAAARARWAKVRAGNTGSASNGSRRGKRRTMSVAARSRIAAAQRARWAKIKGR